MERVTRIVKENNLTEKIIIINVIVNIIVVIAALIETKNKGVTLLIINEVVGKMIDTNAVSMIR